MGNEDNFVIAPKKLLSDKNLSDAAKVMYLLLKDRMTLSIKNGYTDDFGKPCIIYTYESLAELLAWTNKKISKILDIIDKKLEKEEEKLEALKTWKKGLLQQLFV